MNMLITLALACCTTLQQSPPEQVTSTGTLNQVIRYQDGNASIQPIGTYQVVKDENGTFVRLYTPRGHTVITPRYEQDGYVYCTYTVYVPSAQGQWVPTAMGWITNHQKYSDETRGAAWAILIERNGERVMDPQWCEVQWVQNRVTPPRPHENECPHDHNCNRDTNPPNTDPRSTDRTRIAPPTPNTDPRPSDGERIDPPTPNTDPNNSNYNSLNLAELQQRWRQAHLELLAAMKSDNRDLIEQKTKELQKIDDALRAAKATEGAHFRGERE